MSLSCKLAINVILLVTSQVLAGTVRSGIVRDVWDNAETILEHFIATVETAVNGTLPQLDQLERSVSTISTETFEASDEALKITLNRIDAAIERLQDQADRTVVDNCVAVYASQINELRISFNILVSACVIDLETKALIEIESARQKTRATLEISDRLRKDIDDCRIAANSDECVSRVSIEMLLLSLEVSSEVGEIYNRTKDIVGVYTEQVPFCLTDRAYEAEIIGTLIIGGITSCVNFG